MNEKEILEAFDKKFDGLWMALNDWAGLSVESEEGRNPREAIKAFLIKSLSDQRKEIERECNKLIDKCIGENDENYSYIYQKAVEDVIKII